MKWDYGDAVEDFNATGAGLFITNEGNFQYGNATLSYYDPATKQVQNEIFFRANGMKLGDVAQSMTIYDNKGWVVVNNSHVIFAIDLNTFKEVGRIENLTSPRYIHFLSDEKATVTQLWDNRIFIINPKKYEITGYIQVPDMTMESGSTEQMVQYGKYVYCNCWSYQNRIIKIDTETDQVVEELKVGIQPTSLVMDKNHKMWTITDGGYEGSPYGYEAPSLYRIDAETFTVEKQFKFKMGDWPSEVQLNGTGDKLYWISEIEEKNGMSCAQLIEKHGEAEFRELESEAIAALGKRSGAVIATGGGCVTREENYDLLHQNGIIFWLKRDIDQLPREGRPLSAGDLAAMYDRRKACYERFADHIVDNNGTVEDTVQAILDCLK